MIVAIFVLAVILLLAGFAGIVSAINLVPTDLGFTYFQAGATAISAGCIVMALGFAVKTLNRSLQRLARPEQVQGMSGQSTPLDPMLDLPPLPDFELETGKPETGKLETGKPGDANPLGGSLMPAIAIAGGAAAATAWSHSGKPGAVDGKLVDDLEQDLFSQAASLPDPSSVVGVSPESGTSQVLESASIFENPPVPLPEASAHALLGELEADNSLAGKPLADFEFSLPDFALRPVLDGQSESQISAARTDEATSGPSSARIGVGFPEGVVHAADESELVPVLEPEKQTHEHAIPDPMPSARPFWRSQSLGPVEVAESELPPDPALTVPLTEAPAAPAAGLIHDADFAAVADQALPPLAPVSSLDVIGAYDSGGTRFTMYSDGSVVAAGSEGERRFRSLDELRRHIDSGLT